MAGKVKGRDGTGEARERERERERESEYVRDSLGMTIGFNL